MFKVGRLQNMKREDIAKRIAEDLLNDNVLDEQNFEGVKFSL